MIQQLLAFSPLFIWLVWAGGIAILAFRALPQQRAYQQQFAWHNRGKAMWQRQADPELERLRRAIWRLYGYGVLWGVGFPLLATGMFRLVALTGLLNTP